MMTNSAGIRLRALLHRDELVVAPGCYDAATARMVASHGFAAGYVSGACVSALELGRPDLGFAGAAEILQVLARVVPAIEPLPVIADADAGFGEAVHVAEIVRRYERAGVAALHLEDQAMPKRCGHMKGKKLVDVATAVTRVGAAVRARSDLVVIARTDALSIEGMNGALTRCRAYVDAGADALFVEGLRTVDDIGMVRESIGDVPLVVSLSEAGGPVELGLDDLAACGVAIAILPVAGLLAALASFAAVLTNVKSRGRAAPIAQVGWSELTDLLGLPELDDFERSMDAPASAPGGADPADAPNGGAADSREEI